MKNNTRIKGCFKLNISFFNIVICCKFVLRLLKKGVYPSVFLKVVFTKQLYFNVLPSKPNN